MALTKYKLGELIELADDRNYNEIYTVDYVRGIATSKEFIATKADMDGVELHNYKVVLPKYFAYVPDTSRRGEKISLAFNSSNDTYITSSISIVFSLRRQDILLSDYLFMYFNRPEFDRYSRFHSWGSARETFDWDAMCDMDIELPPIEVQQKYVDIYNAMKANQKAYEKGLDDLKLVCDGFIEDLRRNMSCEKVGKYIKKVENKNIEDLPYPNKAVSIEKVFIESHALLDNVDISNYLIVQKNEFAYNTVTTKNGNKISIAINHEENCLVSPIYTVFSVNTSKLLSEYLLLWFKRSEFDRYARYNSWGSAREMFTFDDMCEVSIPIPNLDLQKSIANLYTVFMQRREINEKLKVQIKDLCPILIKGSLEEA